MQSTNPKPLCANAAIKAYGNESFKASIFVGEFTFGSFTFTKLVARLKQYFINGRVGHT